MSGMFFETQCIMRKWYIIGGGDGTIR